MSTTPAAFGTRFGADIPFSGIAGGVEMELGTILPSGKVVCYVNSNGFRDGDSREKAGVGQVATLKLALNKCRAGRGDIIVVEAGHEEDISSADYLDGMVAGTKIVGQGSGNLRPTFTWSVAGSTVLFDVANVSLSNCVLEMAGDPDLTAALTVAAPITVSAAGCTIHGCRIQTAIDANQGTTIAITTTAAGDDFTIANCDIHGDDVVGTLCTTVIQLVGADRFRMLNTHLHAAASSAAVGVVRFLTTASLNVLIQGCTLANKKALSDTCLTGHATSSGVVKDTAMIILDTATTTGADTVGLLQFVNCQTSNTAGDGGADTTPVST